MLVLLRMDKAATFVRWSPLENKFAVCSGQKLVAVCFFDKENNWWVSKHIKKSIRSTVTSLDWHPNNCLIATSSTDFRVRVFSAYIKDVEEQPKPTPWGTKMPLGQLMAEFKNSVAGGGWVHAVAFNLDGNKIAWVAHDSSISVVDANNPQNVIKLKTQFLPFLSILWVTPESFVVAGHDCTPLTFVVKGNQLINSGKFIQTQDKVSSNTAMDRFRRLETTNRDDDSDKTLKTTHQNTITCIRTYECNKGQVGKFATSGIDGKLVIWDLTKMQKV
jgi:actin related protein 2/3 complex subunit 1A/1B